ncbi:MAG: tyrosine-protein phosphatase [Campylobacterota bacterium]|nr:tyrosine-protein phosphatase [Campylobacterota bacterium]
MIIRILKYIFSFIVFLILFAFTYAEIYGNFHKIDNDVYRSGKLNKYNLPYYLNKYEIKTVLNLHGTSSKSWYQNEKDITKSLNVNHINFKMNSGSYYDFNKTSELIEVMRKAQKPMLIHCLGGADRTSLAAALYQYAIIDKSEEEAREQLSWIYGHFPSLRPHVIAMDNSFDNYIKVSKDLKYESK